MFVACVCVSPSAWGVCACQHLLQLRVSFCHQDAHSAPLPANVTHGFILCYLSVSTRACRGDCRHTLKYTQSFQLQLLHSKENFNCKLFHCTTQGPRDESGKTEDSNSGNSFLLPRKQLQPWNRSCLYNHLSGYNSLVITISLVNEIGRGLNISFNILKCKIATFPVVCISNTREINLKSQRLQCVISLSALFNKT